MKETAFYILVSIKTSDGFQSTGKFYIGNDRNAAKRIFHQLKGNRAPGENPVLTMELMETVKELPINLHLIGCTPRRSGDKLQSHHQGSIQTYQPRRNLRVTFFNT